MNLKWKTVLWSAKLKFEVLFGKLGRHVIWTKKDKDNPSCYQRSVQKPASLMVWGCMSACGMGSLHIWKGTIDAERYIQVLEQHMPPSRHRLFQGRPCIFQHDNARPHTASITTSWLRRRRIRVLKWPACSPDLSPIENIWRIIKRKMRQRRPKTVEQLEACIRQKWDNIPIPKLEQLVSSVPRRLQTVIKRRGDATVVNMALSQLFWDVLMPWNLKSTYFSLKMIHFFQFKHLICHLCSILNKIMKFETSTSLHSVFIHNLYSVPTFLESGLYIYSHLL